ncbi:DUF1127 domain-containing protein [Brenneria nigrifluens DSM 30175 = ATCC 13028]|uniref:DUF1127 domain-containing protein n=1 Tax=Brenneria nigrifluens DSM 30175 = ATCC 13028 TaxID=1121120 RepID=A0A2U1UDN4_9GAMM|nr:protein of unknown function DUF1127 [Brenneria sp. EniD312]PWC19789.1 DUF1127 domain-containing protein [Brenneria nigrifluens DSM 30175 = ATCC 13028]QCR06444.1 DUF1127 domain-containing protein [Brenneria nigrifluens DSM 30175 = ATCC 13028]
MKHQADGSQRWSGLSLWRLMVILPYRKWQAWRLKEKTRQALRRMSDERLKDIGLKREDIDRFR